MYRTLAIKGKFETKKNKTGGAIDKHLLKKKNTARRKVIAKSSPSTWEKFPDLRRQSKYLISSIRKNSLSLSVKNTLVQFEFDFYFSIH